MTARTAAACLRDETVLAWVTPPATGPTSARVAVFDAAAFPTSRQTLYLLSKDGAGGAAPLVAALTDRVMRDGVRAAERSGVAPVGGVGGRLDPPMVVALDEAANVCKIADLPDLYSHLGSRGIVPITVLQSYRQGVRVWGEVGMDTLWSAATIKLLGAGLDGAKLAEDVPRLVGEHDVTIRSYSSGDRSRSTSTSIRRQRILAPDELRALSRGTALLLATGTRAALVRLLPTHTGPRRAAEQVSRRPPGGSTAVQTALSFGWTTFSTPCRRRLLRRSRPDTSLRRAPAWRTGSPGTSRPSTPAPWGASGVGALGGPSTPRPSSG